MSSLNAKEIQASYKSGRLIKEVLKDLNLSLETGEFVCLCGPNGCGKSTLLSILAGLENPLLEVKGQVLLDQQLLKSFKASERAKNISYMQQTETSTWDFTVFDYVLQGRFSHSHGGHYSKADMELVSSVLEEMKLSDFAERTVHTLSGGEFQKVRIARCLAQEPKFMLLDEPAASLDYVFEPHLMSFLKNLAHEKNIGIMISVHDINLAKTYADKIVLLSKEKNILSGKSDDIMTLENLKNTFGVEFQCQKIDCFQSLQ